MAGPAPAVDTESQLGDVPPIKNHYVQHVKEHDTPDCSSVPQTAAAFALGRIELQLFQFFFIDVSLGLLAI